MLASRQPDEDPSRPLHKRWAVSCAWLERARENALRERRALRTGTAHTLGTAALDAIRRPWRFPALIEALRTTVRPFPPPYDPVQPTLPDDSASAADPARVAALRDEIQALRAEIRDIRDASTIRLGERLLRLRGQSWKLPLVPLVGIDHLRRERRGLRRAPSAAPITIGSPVATAPAATTRLQRSCLAPAWLTEMLAFDGVETLASGGTRPDLLLVALARDAAVTLHALAEWRAATVRSASSCPVAFWILDDVDAGVLAPLVRDGDRIYAGDRDRIDEVAARVGRPVAHLPLAVQPLLHNPIGWWDGRRGIAGADEASAGVPPLLRTLVDLARGRDVDEREVSVLETRLGTPLPDADAPAWADAALRRDVRRHARLRSILGNETIAARLARVEHDVGLGSANEGAPLVSVAVVTNRPHRLAHAVAAYAAQTYPRRELVIVVQGTGFVARDLDAITAADASIRIHRVREGSTLGDCRQRACDESAGDLICFMDDDNHYGPRYVEQHALALRYSEAGLVGKASHLIRFEDRDRMYLYNPGREYHYMKIFGAGRLGLRREVLNQVRWRSMTVLEDVAFIDDCEARGIPMLSADRFQFVRIRGNPRHHTAPTASAHFFADRPYRVDALPLGATLEDLDV